MPSPMRIALASPKRTLGETRDSVVTSTPYKQVKFGQGEGIVRRTVAKHQGISEILGQAGKNLMNGLNRKKPHRAGKRPPRKSDLGGRSTVLDYLYKYPAKSRLYSSRLRALWTNYNSGWILMFLNNSHSIKDGNISTGDWSNISTNSGYTGKTLP